MALSCMKEVKWVTEVWLFNELGLCLIVVRQTSFLFSSINTRLKYVLSMFVFC